MRAVVFSVLILSAILFIILVLFFALHDSSVDERLGFKLKLNATCKHENYTGIRKHQDPFASNTTTSKVEPCNEGDPAHDCPNQTGENVTNIHPKRTPGEKAEEMCKSYGKTAYRNVSNAFNIGPKYITLADCEVLELTTKRSIDAYVKEFPHMVLMGTFVEEGGSLQWICSGSLVSPEYILSAAHCPISQVNGFAMFGSNRVEDAFDFFDKHVISISEVHIHPDYNPKTNDNDLALYKLSTKLNRSERPICLDTGSSLTSNMQVIATGFTIKEDSTPLSKQESTFVLQKVQMDIVDEGTCAIKYKQFLKDFPKFPVCAYGDTCQGYLGGPIQIRHSNLECMYTLIGVASFGTKCSLETNIPDIYTKVSSYVGWIEDIVWPV